MDLLNNAEEVFVDGSEPSKSSTRQSSIRKPGEEVLKKLALRRAPVESKDEKKENTVSPEDAEREKNERDYLLKNAELLLCHEEFLLARNVYSQLLQKNIRDPLAIRGLGICLFKLGEKTSAKKCFNALWEVYRREDALIWLGRCLVHEGNDQGAIEVFRKMPNGAGMSVRDKFEYFKELGNCQLRVGHYELAQESYQKACEAEPQSDAIHVNLGMLEIQRGRLSDARSCFQKALGFKRENSKAHAGLGLVEMAEDKLEEAAERFCEALDLNSQNQCALLQLIEIAHRTDEFSFAKKRIEIFLEKDPGNEAVRYAHAGLLFKEGQWGSCEETLDSMLKDSPNHRNAQNLKKVLIRHRHRTHWN